MLSLTMQSPESSRLSQGNCVRAGSVDVSGYQLAGVDVGPEAAAQDADLAFKLGNLTQSLHGSLGLDKGGCDTDDGDQEDGSGVVIVLVHRPQEQTGDLEHIEGVEDFVDKQLTERLLSNVNLVLAEDKLAVVALFVVKTFTQSIDFGP
jgi:hypothetical protein